MEIEKWKRAAFDYEKSDAIYCCYAQKQCCFVKYFIRCFDLSHAGIPIHDIAERETPEKFANLTVTILESLELERDLPSLDFVHYEPVSFQPSEVEMPILKKNAENGQQENGIDKGMFSVSRVKKVELSEIPLATDICSTRKSPLDRMLEGKKFSHSYVEMLSHDLPALALMT